LVANSVALDDIATHLLDRTFLHNVMTRAQVVFVPDRAAVEPVILGRLCAFCRDVGLEEHLLASAD
jgi:hypothetical protein